MPETLREALSPAPSYTLGDCVMILGDSGSGKSTSMRNLPPEENFIISTVRKSLPFLGARTNYIEGENHIYTLDIDEVIKRLLALQQRRLDNLNYLCLDDAYFLSMNEFVDKFGRRLDRDGVFSMYRKLAINQWTLLNAMIALPAPMISFIMLHDEEQVFFILIGSSLMTRSSTSSTLSRMALHQLNLRWNSFRRS